MNLRYYKSEESSEAINGHTDSSLGSIHLASVNAVLPSRVPDAPEHALDLVCADRIYTLAGMNREDMVRWATVFTLVVRKKKERHIYINLTIHTRSIDTIVLWRVCFCCCINIG